LTFIWSRKPDHPTGHSGKVGLLPSDDNVHEVNADDVASREFDVILYQQRSHWERDRETLLSPAQRRLPGVYLEHDPPQESPFGQWHWVDDPDTLLVHVTHFNQLMWDNGITPTRVIEHGVVVSEGVRYSGELERGIVVVNHLAQRGRPLGADIFSQVRSQVPLDLVGMDAQSLGGIGEMAISILPRFLLATASSSIQSAGPVLASRSSRRWRSACRSSGLRRPNSLP
jgi:hypothetical protein